MTQTLVASVEYAKGQRVRYLPTGDTGKVLQRLVNPKQGQNLRVEMGNGDYLTMPVENWERVE